MCSYIVGISLFFFLFYHEIASQKLCQNKICVLKCCPDKEVIIVGSNSHCEKSNGSIPLSSIKDIKVVRFTASSEKKETVGKFEDFFHLDNRIFKFKLIWGNREDFDVTELHKDGTLFSYLFNESDVREVEDYCVGWDEEGEVVFGIDSKEQVANDKSFYRKAFCFVTCIFLLLVLIVYAMLKELRNFEGKMFISYNFSLFCALTLFAIFGTLNFFQSTMTEKTVLAFNFFVYFFFMASFLWMNVISFDLWRSLRKLRVNRRLDRVLRFRVYSAYAWGVALALSINLIVLETLDASTIPWCTKPNIINRGSFLQGYEKLVYFYTPMMILLLCNLIFFTLTVILLWRSYCDTRIIANTNKKRQTIKKRFVLYIKLSLVMGLSWILEVVSYFDSGNPIWAISDYYNLLVGPLIFIFFICKKKIFKGLYAKLLSNRKEERNESSNTSTTKTKVELRKL